MAFRPQRDQPLCSQKKKFDVKVAAAAADRKNSRRTLRDAAQYITKLPKAEHDADEWQAAMEALLLVAKLDGPPLFARIGIMRALNRPRRARVQCVAQGSSLGKTETETRRVTNSSCKCTTPPSGI